MSHLTLGDIAGELKPWVEHNFPDAPAWQPLLGAGEELGELYHAYLKRAQGIRVNEDHDAAIQDALGDILIYLMHFCMIEDIDLEECASSAWLNVVKKRDWRADASRGTQAPVQ